MLSSALKNNRKNLMLIAGVLIMLACESQQEKASHHFEKGKDLFEKGEYDKAVLELKTSNQDDKKGETYYYIALLDEKQNNLKSMRQNLLRALELDSGLTDARLKLGKLDVLFGDLDKALEQSDAILQTNPDDQDARLIKASVFMKQSKDDEAEKIIDSILVENPESIDALMLKASIFLKRNDAEKAQQILSAGIDKNEDNIPLRMLRISVNTQLKNTSAIIEDYKNLIRLDPNNERFKFSLASVYSKNENLPEAEELLKGMVDASPEKVEPKVVFLGFLDARIKDRVVPEYERWLADSTIPEKQVLELSEWMIDAGFPEAGEKGLKRVAATLKDNNDGLMAQTLLGEMALRQKKYAEAEAAIDSVLKINSDFTRANLLKARVLISQSKVDEAIELLNKLVWSKDTSGDVYLLLGQAYAKKKDKKLAEKNFKQALDVNPGNLGAFFSIYPGYLQTNQRETARQLLEKALRVKPNEPMLLATKTELDIDERKWDDAQETVGRLVVLSKNRWVPVYLEANILQGRGQFPEAIAIYERLLEEFPDHLNSMVNLTISYEAIKARDKAIAYLQAHHAKYPDDMSTVSVLSGIYIKNHEVGKARQLLHDQIKRTPKSVMLYLELAKIEAKQGEDLQAAKAIYLKGLENNPDDPSLLLSLAGLYELIGDKANARKIYERILEKSPDFEQATNNLASILIEETNPEDVQRGLNLAEKLKNSDNAYFLDTYAWALVKTGQTEQGLKILESLVLKEPKLPDIRYHLAVADFNKGNTVTAVTELKQAISMADKQHRVFNGLEDAKKMLQDIEHSKHK